MKLLPIRLKGHVLGIICVASTLFISTVAVHAADLTSAAALAADTGRPAEDTARDADRKPADMLAFAQVKPGNTVVDYFPGKGYFTRVLSTAVGPQGTVYAVTPQLLIDKLKGRPLPPPVSAEAGRSNVHEAIGNGATLNVPVKADLVWTSQNYHDIHIWGGADGAVQLNKAAFDALKPGGIYVVLDHAAAAGLDDAGMAKLHRIDEALVKKEVTAVGFVLDGESQLLRNPADPRNAAIFDASIRGKTDQFILRFRKP
ncbi:class I SAM-dependent methyltransferase [Undibacterium sp. TJN25]|uniref:class I SAM-dependent methyltransferase n=1 Tax=Undibacterium sp. TJN25 TaxID=3413056 RepID=UPI003BF3CE2B